MYLSFVLLTVFVSCANTQPLLTNYSQNYYGPFVFRLTEYSVCPSWHQRFKMTVGIGKEVNETDVLMTNITYTENVVLDSVRVAVYKDGNALNTLWKYNVKKPCQHPVLSPILHQICRTDRRCIIKQGQYLNKFVANDAVFEFFGKQFFYGDFSVKVTFVAKNFIITCVIMKCTFVKKL